MNIDRAYRIEAALVWIPCIAWALAGVLAVGILGLHVGADFVEILR